MAEVYSLSDEFTSLVAAGEQQNNSPATTSISQAGLDFIKKREGFSTKAYEDYKQYSIGYGTKAKSADEIITKEEAEKRLAQETKKVSEFINNRVTYPLTQNQHDSLVSFGYNVGLGGINSLLDDINNGRHETVSKRMLTWNRAGGEVNQGLVNRRQEEASLYSSTVSNQESVANVLEDTPTRTSPIKGEPQKVMVPENSLIDLLSNLSRSVSIAASNPYRNQSYRLGNYS